LTLTGENTSVGEYRAHRVGGLAARAREHVRVGGEREGRRYLDMGELEGHCPEEKHDVEEVTLMER